MSLLLPRRRIGRMVIYFVCFVLVVAAGDLVLVQWRDQIQPGFDTTRIVAPVLPDGSIDFLMAIENRFSQGVTPENNSAPLLLMAIGRAGLPSNQPPDGITDQLLMAHLPDRGDYFVTYENYCRDHSLPDTISSFDPNPWLTWPPTIDQTTSQWVKSNEKPLARIAEATQRTRYWVPLYGGNRLEAMAFILLPHVSLLRAASEALLARAVIRLESGDADGFAHDTLTVHRLARLVNQSPTLVERASSYIIETEACHVDRLGPASGKLSRQQDEKMADDLDSLGEINGYVDSINECERYLLLEPMQSIAHAPPAVRAELVNMALGGFNYSGAVPAFLVRFWPIPCEGTMRVLNHYYDGMIAAVLQPTYAQRMDAMNLWRKDIDDVNEVTALFTSDWPVRSLLPSLIKLETRYTTARMERRLTVIALKLAAYKGDHGSYPASLDELSTPSNDFFVERPLTYAVRGNGYELYSVGANMTDDGGKKDDIAVEMP